MARLRYNGLRAVLNGAVTTTLTTLQIVGPLTHSGGVAVPTISGSDYIPLSILDSTGNLSEVVWVTAYTSGANTVTVTRGQEGTTAVTHNGGDRMVGAANVVDLYSDAAFNAVVAGAASASASAAAAAASAANARDISNISTSDDSVEALVKGTAGAGPKTRAALGTLTGVTVSVAFFADLATAIAALPAAGGTVLVPLGRFRAGDFSTPMTKANVRLLGTQMPRWSDNVDRLIGGSIIEGPFRAYAHGLTVENVGFDYGKYVCDTYYGGIDQTSGEHTAFATFYPSQTGAARNGVNINNVIGLLRSPASVGHAILMEAINGGTADNVVGIGGIHALVIKSSNMQVGRLAGYCASTNHIIIKADTYAPAGNITVAQTDTDNTTPYGTPHFTTVQASRGVYVEAFGADMGPVEFGAVVARGAADLFLTGRSGSFTIARVSVADLQTSGGGTGLHVYQQAVKDLDVTAVRSRDNIQGLVIESDQASSTRLVHIGRATVTGTTGGGGNVSITFTGYATATIDAVTVRGVNHVYYMIDATTLLKLATEDVSAYAGNKFLGPNTTRVKGPATWSTLS